ncbi:hypothetical protein [Pseudonocardia kongjuensis]|uniref:hypothetical protein n=1 Tax=Pseudonocardia kongjuensis TaxID=102227 RepID=UPI0031E427AC
MCGQARAAARTLCLDCCRDVARMLDPAWAGDRDQQLPASIPVLWERLDPFPAAGDPSGRRAPGFCSMPPLDLQAVVLRDPRSRPDPVVPVWYPPHPRDGRDDWSRPLRELDGEPRPTEWAIVSLAESVFEVLDVGCTVLGDERFLPGGLLEHCVWMLDRVEEITALPHAAEVHHDLTVVLDDLRGPAGDPAERSIGGCNAVVGRGEQRRLCDEPLYLPPPRPGHVVPAGEPVLRCRACDKPYRHMDLLRMEIGSELAGQAS